MLDQYAAIRQFITIDNECLGYVTAGKPSAPPVIMVHGWLSHARTFRQTIEALQDQYYCVSVDLLGHGYSDKPQNGDYSIHSQASRVLKLVDALGIGTFAYIGHSMGGMIGLYIASTLAPERITRLVDVSGVADGLLSPYVRYVLTPIYAAGMVIPSIWTFSRMAMNWRWYAYTFDRALYHDPRQSFEPVSAEDRQMALMCGNEVPAYRDLQAIRAVNLTDALPHIQTPTLVLFGKNDHTVPLDNAYLVQKYVPGARLVLLDNCGHVPMTEQPEAYLKAVSDFLAE